jgi:hypothetical protein
MVAMKLGKTFSIAALTVLGGACNDTEADPNLEVATAALSASEAEGDGQAMGALAFPRGAGMTAEQRVQAFTDFIDANLSCAEATPSGAGVELTFSTNCVWSGRRWTGSVTFAWDGNGDRADVTYDGLKVNGATLTGEMSVTRVEEDHVIVAADWTRVTARGKTIVGSWDGDYEWDEAAYTVNSASHVVTVDGVAANRTATDIVWQRDEIAPESGTVSITNFRGRSWTMTHGRDDAGNLTVTVTRPNGATRTYTIGADGQPAL